MRKTNTQALGIWAILLFAFVVLVFIGLMNHKAQADNRPVWTHTGSDGVTNSYPNNNLMYAGPNQGEGFFASNVFTSGSMVISGTLYAAQVSTSTGVVVIPTINAVTVTSPTTTFSATGQYLVALNASASITNVRPTGGVTGQYLEIYAGATNANTMTFVDNVSTMSLGSNRVLTGQNYSFIGLLCTQGGTGTHSRWLMREYQAN